MKFQLLAVAALAGPAAASLRALQDCAGIDQRSQQCGAENPTRPEECCEVRYELAFDMV